MIGIDPDMLASDGTFTAFYRPLADDFYNISVRLDSTVPSASFMLSPTDSSPVDHCIIILPKLENFSIIYIGYPFHSIANFSCCVQSFEEDSISTTYQRLIPYAAKVQVIGASSYSVICF